MTLLGSAASVYNSRIVLVASGRTVGLGGSTSLGCSALKDSGVRRCTLGAGVSRTSSMGGRVRRVVIPGKGETSVAFSSNAEVCVGSNDGIVCPSVFRRQGHRVLMRKRICLSMTGEGSYPFIIGAERFSVHILNASFGIYTCERSRTTSIILMHKDIRMAARGGDGMELTPGRLISVGNGGARMHGISISRCVD